MLRALVRPALVAGVVGCGAAREAAPPPARPAEPPAAAAADDATPAPLPPQRLSRVVTLGQSTWEPLPPPRAAGGASGSSSTTVVVVQPPPAYGFGVTRFGTGYVGTSGHAGTGWRGTYGGAPAVRPGPLSSGASVPPVGGDWPAAPSYGPRPMGRSSR